MDWGQHISNNSCKATKTLGLLQVNWALAPRSTKRLHGSSVFSHLPLVLEVPRSIPARGEKILVSEHAFSGVICRDDAR